MYKNIKGGKMKKVIFPGINLNLKLKSVAINIFEIHIYWYAIFIVVAIGIGLLLCKKDEGKYNIKFEDILTMILIGIPIAIICARLYYVIFRLDYYTNNPLEIINIRDGGLAIYGGIIGGATTVLVYSRLKKFNFLDLLDYIVPYLALGQAIGRWGNFFNQEAYGTETNSIFRMGIIENGNYIEVHPTFLYESVCNLIIFIILYLIRNKREYKGQLTYIYLTLYGFARCFIEGLRADSLMIGCFRISQLLSIILFMVFGTILIYKTLKKKEKTEKVDKICIN